MNSNWSIIACNSCFSSSWLVTEPRRSLKEVLLWNTRYMRKRQSTAIEKAWCVIPLNDFMASNDMQLSSGGKRINLRSVNGTNNSHLFCQHFPALLHDSLHYSCLSTHVIIVIIMHTKPQENINGDKINKYIKKKHSNKMQLTCYIKQCLQQLFFMSIPVFNHTKLVYVW